MQKIPQKMPQRKTSGKEENKQKERKPIVWDEPGEGSRYMLMEGLEMVVPYFYEFKSFAKRRWFGRTVEDVFEAEFFNFRKENFDKQIENKEIRINDRIVEGNYKFKDNDRLSHRLHYHENPVLTSDVKIIKENDDYFAVVKPCLYDFLLDSRLINFLNLF
ncbi:hypothetical protein MHBO_003525 [Bonamia ostreae]|uniref:Uncharacterized protein n=1 Tax=Bonamia ostreae TaxID=126728 RepID=A0ABV2AQU0_9EUKA